MTSSSRTSTHRTVAPASRAAMTHGRTFASWSRRVTTTSSPGASVRANDRDRCSSSEVAFWPNTTSSGSHPRKSAPARVRLGDQLVDLLARAGTRRACSRRPPRIRPAIASITMSGTCEPPGASAHTNGRPSGPGRASAGKRARTASTSNVEAACRVVITAKRPTGRSRHRPGRKGRPVPGGPLDADGYGRQAYACVESSVASVLAGEALVSRTEIDVQHDRDQGDERRRDDLGDRRRRSTAKNVFPPDAERMPSITTAR